MALVAWACVPLYVRAQTVQAAELVGEAERTRQNDPEAALVLVQRALPLLEAGADRDSRVKAEVIRCWAATEVEGDSIAAYASSLLPLAEASGNATYVARARLCRGYAAELTGDISAAVADYDFVVRQAGTLRNDTLKAEALVLRGGARYYRGEFNTALSDLNVAYKIFSAIGHEGRRRYTLNAFANIYADPRVAEFDKALEYYRQLLAANTARGAEREMAVDYFNLGSTLENQGRLNEALVEYRHGLDLDMKRNDPDEVAEDRRAIAVALYKMNRPAEALRLLDLALAHVRTTRDVEMLSRIRLSRGVVLRMLGRSTEALHELDLARAQFVAKSNPRFLERTEQERALAHAALGNWQEAYLASASQSRLQRALSDSSRNEQSSRLRAQFDADKKEAENEALLRENAASARIRNLQMAVLALSALVITVLLVQAWRQIQHARRLRITAMTDELTQLLNRRSLMLVANEQFREARARHSHLGVLAIDIDHFKKINDNYGHPAGDAVLRRIAAAVQAVLRVGDHVGRTGGEEFVAILPHTTDSAVDDVANRIREAIEATDFSDIDADLRVTASIGTAVSDDTDMTFSNTIKRADDSLYRAKEGGRNRVETAGAAAGGAR